MDEIAALKAAMEDLSAEHKAALQDLDTRLAVLEGQRPGRKRKPIVVSQQGTCGVDPALDSTSCPHASIYYRRQGCLGTACVALNKSYYHNRREKLRG